MAFFSNELTRSFTDNAACVQEPAVSYLFSDGYNVLDDAAVMFGDALPLYLLWLLMKDSTFESIQNSLITIGRKTIAV